MTLPGTRPLKLPTGKLAQAEGKTFELSRVRVCRRCGTVLSHYNRARDLCFRCCNVLAHDQ